MVYYLKKLGHQELGSIQVKGDKPSRGRYIYISKDNRVLSFFPPLSRYVKNDSSLLPIIPLYNGNPNKIYCNYIYHNDKYNGSTAASPRDEYRIYSNNALEMDQVFFEANDILVMKKLLINQGEENQTVYFLDRVTKLDSHYNALEMIIKSSDVSRNHAIYNHPIIEVEKKIKSLTYTSFEPVVDSSVTTKIQKSDTQVSELFNATSFRDFTMVAYSNTCAVTGTSIGYNKFFNLEAAHIMPKSHGGTFLPSNGMALSRDIHWAFDKGFFTLNNDLTIRVHPKIESDFLRSFQGKQIRIPDENFFKPSIESIIYHNEYVYGLFLTSGRL
ncbi:HNH endonuclease [Rossellomorea marisflavi]|uniref:HNH endonuclease n=1 Tax=Rossellomorea marisflavi TaxID=189381 RepID=UPI00064F067F|nr:HNH endonuclease [Rossellomorea marisflavi]KML03175.1 hypothetical protein VL06_16185 [Rossellomorea marisflavi]